MFLHSVNFAKFSGGLFCRRPPDDHFWNDAIFFFFLFADQWALQPKKIYLVGQCYIRQRNSQPFQFCVVMKISRELHLPSGYYDLLKGKEDNLWRALLSFVKITNFNMTRFFTRNNKLKYCEIFKNTYFEEHLGTVASE